MDSIRRQLANLSSKLMKVAPSRDSTMASIKNSMTKITEKLPIKSQNSTDICLKLLEDNAVLQMKNKNLTTMNSDLMRQLHNTISSKEHEQIVTSLNAEIEKLHQQLLQFQNLKQTSLTVKEIKDLIGHANTQKMSEELALLRNEIQSLRAGPTMKQKIENMVKLPKRILQTYIGTKAAIFAYRWLSPSVAGILAILLFKVF